MLWCSMRGTKHTEFNDSSLVLFDIETTGFDLQSEVTCLTLYMDETFHMFVNLPDNHDFDREHLLHVIDDIEDLSEFNFRCHTTDSEKELLNTVNDFANQNIEWDEYYITAYNGEVWKGGFDLSFLRTVAARYDNASTPFAGLYYIDLYPVFQKGRINTCAPSLEPFEVSNPEDFADLKDYVEYTQESKLDTDENISTVLESVQENTNQITPIREWFNNREDMLCCNDLPTKRYTDLSMVHRVLSVDLYGESEEKYNELHFDPWEDSENAVTAYENGNITDVILHCLADVKQTLELSLFIERVSEDDISWRQIPY